MKKVLGSIPILAVIFLATASNASEPSGDSRIVRVYGASTLAGLIQPLGEEYTKQYPDVRIQVLGRTSRFGFEALLNNEGDLVMAARKPTTVERRLAEKRNVQWNGVRIAWENVAVISNPDVSLTGITVDQLRQMYIGKYTNWRELGGPDLPIRLHSLAYPKDDIAVWFLDTVLSKAEFTSGITWVDTPDFLVRHVSVHAGSVAYLGYIQLSEALKRHPVSKVRVLSLSTKPGEPAVSPSGEIARKGDYPLTVPLFLFWNEKAHNKLVERFARFCAEMLSRTGGE